MPKSSKAQFIGQIPKDLHRRIVPSSNPFVTNANEMIERLNTLGGKLPKTYGWRFRTVEAFQAEMADIAKSASDKLPLNRFYWRDQLGNWEAYSVMNCLRVIDLSRSCIWALARQDILCASLLSRSVLETAVAFVDASRTVNASLVGPDNSGKMGPIADQSINLRETIVASEELEQYSLKTIFASRLPEVEAIYNPTNIVTIISRISKVPSQEFLVTTYNMLCEAAHPNLLGRTLYIQGVEPGTIEGNEIRQVGWGNGPSWPQLAAAIVAALSWACAAQVSAFELMGETFRTVLQRLASIGQPEPAGS